jgi:hypothetical protein
MQLALRVPRVQGRPNCRERRVLFVAWSMCGRFVQHYTWSNQLRLYRLTAPARNLQPRHNIAPTEIVDVIVPQHGGHALVPMR